MKTGTRTGMHFGLTSGVITTLGLMVGLHAGTHSTAAVIGGIITIAIADSLADALGIHIAKESEPSTTTREVWLATFATLITKLLVTASFLIPVLVLPLNYAIIAGVVWGLGLLVVLSFKLALDQNTSPWAVVAEHTVIAIFVIVSVHVIGEKLGAYFSP